MEVWGPTWSFKVEVLMRRRSVWADVGTPPSLLISATTSVM
jgi:hypothetical protein